jgi:hypothetical protein
VNVLIYSGLEGEQGEDVGELSLEMGDGGVA